MSSRAFLGKGNGFWVQVIDTAEQVIGCKISVTNGPRRHGDPTRFVADSRLAREKLGWQPQYADLATIIEDALRRTTRGD